MHHTDLKVRFSELDPYGHVNHAVYVTYLEVARTEALESIGLALDELAAAGNQIVVTELEVRFRMPAVAGDLLSVETEVSEIRGASSRWRQRIVRNGDVLVTAELRGGFTDVHGKPARLPEHYKERLRQLAG
jgi:YbgC/YbaW family acyl-CoA thioester hydrolase